MTITLSLCRPRAEYIVSKSGDGYNHTAVIDETIECSFDDQVGIHITFPDYWSYEICLLHMFHLGVTYDYRNDLQVLNRPNKFKDISVSGRN